MDFMTFDPIEKSRIYHWADGNTLKIENVKKLYQSDSGKHLLETEDGKKYIVQKDWRYIELDTEGWT